MKCKKSLKKNNITLREGYNEKKHPKIKTFQLGGGGEGRTPGPSPEM